jgi:hypothetical protein
MGSRFLVSVMPRPGGFCQVLDASIHISRGVRKPAENTSPAAGGSNSPAHFFVRVYPKLLQLAVQCASLHPNKLCST